MIARDKILHLIAGCVISTSSYIIAPFTGLSSIQVAMAATFMAAVGKEVYDLTGRGTPEVADILFTVLGMIPIMWFHFIFLGNY